MDEKKESVKNEILEQYTHDVRTYMDTLKTVVIALGIVLALLVAGLIILEIHHQNKMTELANYSTDKMIEFLNEYDWEVEYEILSTNNELFSGNVNIER